MADYHTVPKLKGNDNYKQWDVLIFSTFSRPGTYSTRQLDNLFY